MERFVILSIIVFSIFILMLYFYLLFEKIIELIKYRLRKKYEDHIFDFVDNLVLNLEEGIVTENQIKEIKRIIDDKIKMDLFEGRIIYYFNIYKGEIIKKLIKLVEDIGIVDIELQNLKSKNIYKVSLTLKKLGEFRSKRAIEGILEALKIESTDVKYNAFLALSKIGDEKAFIKAFESLSGNILLSERSLIEIIDDFEGDKQYVYKKMFNSKDNYLASIFIKSASNFMDISLNEIAVKFLKEDNKEKKIAAIKLIGNTADVRFIDEIIKCLEDETWEVRAVAAKVLERFSDERAVIPLVKALSDKVWFVRYNAAISLIKIPGGIDAIDEVMKGEDRFAKDIILYAAQHIAGDDKNYEKEKLANILEKYKG
ncbi:MULTISPECIES: HEAT repeat domain-containing protein [Caloramator]|uniref:PBS lyase HEAT domain protein repeat-containing protein n=1 Tax=Caloramator australicus RC3 TaxID=857293 RepID=I7KWH9_9CLOT|nr:MULTISPECIES: HEAT repeat domain-containing protein [Caloramator]MDO6355745.1 HEAT repeat domain-containing protein [Caloramator sp. CAR-1]CCJ34526.1 PBS lyase HEAT domain protein repeat-containing protein [Caloramator australicus RC3]